MAKVSMTPKRSLHIAKMQTEAKPQMKRALTRIRTIIRKEVRANLSGRILNRRSGKLRGGLQSPIKVWRQGGRQILGRLTVGYDLSEIPYARIQALGGWTGRGHKTKIKKTAFLRRALTAQKQAIRTEVAHFVARLARY